MPAKTTSDSNSVNPEMVTLARESRGLTQSDLAKDSGLDKSLVSKIESGVIAADVMPVSFKEIASFAESTFKPISEAKNLKFEIEVQEGLPELMETDMQRLNQILKNLLSNAFKFTEKGKVKLHIFRPGPGQENPLADMDSVIAFSIEDSLGSSSLYGIFF